MTLRGQSDLVITHCPACGEDFGQPYIAAERYPHRVEHDEGWHWSDEPCEECDVSEATHVSQPRVDSTGTNGAASPELSHEEGGR